MVFASKRDVLKNINASSFIATNLIGIPEKSRRTLIDAFVNRQIRYPSMVTSINAGTPILVSSPKHITSDNYAATTLKYEMRTFFIWSGCLIRAVIHAFPSVAKRTSKEIFKDLSVAEVELVEWMYDE